MQLGRVMELIIRDAIAEDLMAIVEIYNQAILAGEQTADLTVFTTEVRKVWFTEHNSENYPIMVAMLNNTLVGWISVSPYRKRDALLGTVEVSYYIHQNHQRKGIGNLLLNAAITRSKEIGYRNIIAILFATNMPSIKLLEKNGFRLWGTMPEIIEVGNQKIDHLFYGRKL